MIAFVVIALASVFCVAVTARAGLRAREREGPGGGVPSVRRLGAVLATSVVAVIVLLTVLISLRVPSRTSGLLTAVIVMLLITFGLTTTGPRNRG